MLGTIAEYGNQNVNMKNWIKSNNSKPRHEKGSVDKFGREIGDYHNRQDGHLKQQLFDNLKACQGYKADLHAGD